MDQPSINTRNATSPEQIIEALERAGVQPVEDPRELSRRLASLALDHIFDQALALDVSDDLRIAARLMATIATINGPGQESRH